MSSGGSAQRNWLVLATLWAAMLLVGAPAHAALIFIGGNDANSQFTGAGVTSPEAGVLTFDDTFNSTNVPELGVVTSCENDAGAACADFGLDILSSGVPTVNFAAVLSATQENGIDPFDPATDNINKASFVGMAGPDFVIWDPNGSGNILLAFELSFVDVTQAKKKSSLFGDPDGTITLGDADPNALTSLLTVSGGSLNHLVGGVGTPARLQVQMATLTPGILTKSDLSGYFNTNFLSGEGAEPRADTIWDITIVPEPSTAALLGVSLLGLVGLARRYSRPE